MNRQRYGFTGRFLLREMKGIFIYEERDFLYLDMTKKEQYGLSFLNWENEDKTIVKICRREIVDEYSELQVLNRFNITLSKSLIDQIDRVLNNEYFEKIFSSDAIDDNSIEIHPPFIIINDLLQIRIEDMKELLNEWIVFLKAEEG
ncbi:hypothetical protein [Flavobacterium sp. AG291]|uniref:hypothetical protein n=1 Tax=Flavobacterium sp. AG291 TaxID=2184000 RepID=UPI0011C03EFB|nr:hypothetical protein [Flavobacterium sp. AG291]